MMSKIYIHENDTTHSDTVTKGKAKGQVQMWIMPINGIKHNDLHACIEYGSLIEIWGFTTVIGEGWTQSVYVKASINLLTGLITGTHNIAINHAYNVLAWFKSLPDSTRVLLSDLDKFKAASKQSGI